MAEVILEKVRKVYPGDVTAVVNFDLQIADAEFVLGDSNHRHPSVPETVDHFPDELFGHGQVPFLANDETTGR